MKKRRVVPSLAILAVVGVIGLSVPVFAQTGPALGPGVPDDWTHHHLVFGNPGTFNEAMKNGNFTEWYRAINSTRYKMQQVKRELAARGGLHPRAGADGPNSEWGDEDAVPGRGNGKRETTTGPLTRDWSQPLGTGTGINGNMFPAIWESTSTASCTDYAVFPIDATPGSSQANIIAFNNLYVNSSGTGLCSGTNSTVMFAYNVGSGPVETAPVLGPNGNKVAFIESVTGGAIFHVLTFGTTGSNGTSASAPAVPGTSNNASVTTLTLNGNVSVTRSAPWVDYDSDTAYVGDDTGVLHIIAPVFCPDSSATCTPIETSHITISSGHIMDGPVYDEASGNVYVGDSNGVLWYYRTSASTKGTCSTGSAPCIGSTHITVGNGGTYGGLYDSPVVDSTNQTVFAGTGAGASGHPAVVQVTTAFGTEETASLGTVTTDFNVHAGTFDNEYYTTPSTGHMYWVGSDSNGYPALWYVTFNSGTSTMGTTATQTNLGSTGKGTLASTGAAGIDTAPPTEILNGTTDLLFLSVNENSCGGKGSAGGCVMNFYLGNGTTASVPTFGPWLPSTAYATDAEIVDTNGNLQECTGGGCGTVSLSNTTPPTWAGSGTTADGTSANASAVGTAPTVTTNISGEAVTIGGLTLTAATTTAAEGTVNVLADPGTGGTLVLAGTTYTFHSSSTGCGTTANCIIRGGTDTEEAENIVVAIMGSGTCGYTSGGQCVYNGTTNSNVSATSSGAVVTLSAKQTGTSAGSGGNSLYMDCSDGDFGLLGGTTTTTTKCSTTHVVLTGGADGSSTAPNFQWTGSSGVVSASQLAANIAAAITTTEQTSYGITLSYTSGNPDFTITGSGSNAGAAGNSVAVGGTLTGFEWTYDSNSTTTLQGGSTPLTWTYQSAAANGQSTAVYAGGTTGIVIDNTSSSAGASSIYFGTPSDAVKLTQSKLQ